MHTSPVSACARANMLETLTAYRDMGYDGVFVTEHFIDGNINRDVRHLPYPEMLEYYFTAYLEAKSLEAQVGIKVFFGVEMSYGGTDFLVYGLDMDWYRNHLEIMDMTKKEELAFMREAGALIIHAHPFREASYIDHIRLYPREVEGVEIINASRTEGENAMAALYCEHYGLLPFAGTDNHVAGNRATFAGLECEEPINSEEEFIRAFREGKMKIFTHAKEV
jgi:predicted metal-dependent phosphoesterase TrpH